MKAQPSIQTKRLLLRAFRMSDAKDVQRIAGHKLVAATTRYIPHPYPDGYAEAWISTLAPNFDRGLQMLCAIEMRENGRMIGSIGFDFHKDNESASLGYWLDPEMWGQGFATEASKGMIAYGFNVLKLNRIQANHLTRNPASGRVLQKAGMLYEGTERESTRIRGKLESLSNYAILKSDFEKIQRGEPIEAPLKPPSL